MPEEEPDVAGKLYSPRHKCQAAMEAVTGEKNPGQIA